jgi:outer membrane protein assembly factor BamA
LAWCAVARAEGDERPARPIVAFRMHGDTKTQDTTALYLSHRDLGDVIGPSDIPALEGAFVSSELFERVKVTLEDAPGGYVVVVDVSDKHSWVIAPTVFALPGRSSLGVGFAENNFRGLNQKLLFYGQLGDRESLLFLTYLIPQMRGTPLSARFDIFLYDRVSQEYANPTDNARDASVVRETTVRYLGGGFLLGWRFAWWLNADLRLRGARVDYTKTIDPRDPTAYQRPTDRNGDDFSSQARITLDARHYRFGVSWGWYAQIMGDTSVPGLDDYDYSSLVWRLYKSWRILEQHQLELRTTGGIGRNLPFHEELTLGSAVDLRGYESDRFRGDTRLMARAEYSVPLAKWRMFAFRGLGFFDSGFIGLYHAREESDRVYLPNQRDGLHYVRTDVGGGIRLYVKSVVLPLLGLDVGYGLEAHSTQLYFELGLTDF